MLTRTVFLGALAGWAMCIGGLAQAATTDWFPGSDQRQVEKRLHDKLLQKIECRDTHRVGLNVADFEYRVTYTDNPNKIRVRWAIGSHYGPVREKARRDGYRQVSYDSFRRKKSGLLVHCAVWHPD